MKRVRGTSGVAERRQRSCDDDAEQRQEPFTRGTALAPARSVEKAPSQPRAWPELFFRVATSLIFVVAGLGHVARPDAMIARLLEAPLGQRLAALLPVQPLMLLSGMVLIVAGAFLAAGYRTRLAAAALIAVLVPLTVTAHLGHGDDPGPLLKNIALLGSLLHFAVNGSRKCALDGRRPPNATASREAD